MRRAEDPIDLHGADVRSHEGDQYHECCYTERCPCVEPRPLPVASCARAACLAEWCGDRELLCLHRVSLLVSVQGVIATGVPAPTRSTSHSIAASSSRTQPCDTAVPSVPPTLSRP